VVVKNYWPAASAAAIVSIVAARMRCRGWTGSIRTSSAWYTTPGATTSAY